jgi:archaellum component FlaC
MKKLALFLACAMFLVGFSGCGGRNDPEDVLNELSTVTEEFVTAADSAQDADEAVAAIDDYFKKVSKLSPRLGSVMRKYPQLRENPPEEFKDIVARLKEANDEFNDAMAALNDDFGEDPKYIQGKKRIYREAGSPF